MKEYNFEKACRLASIKVKNNSDKLIIRTIFNLSDKSNVGSLLFLVLGSTVGALSLTYSKDLFGMIAGSLLGFGVATMSLLVVLSQMTSYCIISGHTIELKSRLKLTKQDLSPNHKVRMKTRVEYTKLNSLPASGSYFRIVELYLSDGTGEQLILDFQTNEEDSTIANQLGNDLVALIKNRLRSLSNI